MTEKINRVSNLQEFVKSWDDGGVSSKNAKVVRGPSGNINLTGKPNDVSWNIVKNDKRFESFIEPGVRDLVLVIVNHLELVTYTSCEGHAYTDDLHKPDRRHVGIAPRNLIEAGQIWKLVEPLCAQLSEEVAVRLEVTTLDDKFNCYLAFQLSFEPLLTWEQYFDVLDNQYKKFVDRLLRLPPIGARTSAH